MNRELTIYQFIKVTDTIQDCQMKRIDREHELDEKLGKEKPTEDRYDTDKLLKLWLDIENELEGFLENLGYVYHHFSGKFLYVKSEIVN